MSQSQPERMCLGTTVILGKKCKMLAMIFSNLPDQSLIFLSISILHFSAYVFIDQMTPIPLTRAKRPMIVQSHPLPMARMSGAAMIPPTQENMFRTKLLTAIPVDALRGINSVNIVVAIANIIIDPTPKKKRAMS